MVTFRRKASMLMRLLLARPLLSQRQRTGLLAIMPFLKRVASHHLTRHMFHILINSRMLNERLLNRTRRLLIRRQRARFRQVHRNRLINLRRGIAQRPLVRIGMLLLLRFTRALTFRAHVHLISSTLRTQHLTMFELRRLFKLQFLGRAHLSSRTFLNQHGVNMRVPYTQRNLTLTRPNSHLTHTN